MNISRFRSTVLRFGTVQKDLNSFLVGMVLRSKLAGQADSVVVPLANPEKQRGYVALCPVNVDRTQLEPSETAFNMDFVEENYEWAGEVIDLDRFGVTA